MNAHVDILGQAANANVFKMVTRVLLEYPVWRAVKLIQKHEVTNRFYSHIAGRVSRGVCSGCASRSNRFKRRCCSLTALLTCVELVTTMLPAQRLTQKWRAALKRQCHSLACVACKDDVADDMSTHSWYFIILECVTNGCVSESVINKGFILFLSLSIEPKIKGTMVWPITLKGCVSVSVVELAGWGFATNEYPVYLNWKEPKYFYFYLKF